MQQIRLRLTSKQKAALAQPHLVNPEAFGAYLQGHYYFERDSDKDAEMAAKYFERATQLDASHALAWVGLSRARNWQVNIGLIPVEDGLDGAEADYKKAQELRPDDLLSSFLLSEIYVMQGRPQNALPEIERVGYPGARMFLYAIAYHALGRKKESDAALRELIAKYQATDTYRIAEVYAFRNQSDEAFAWLDRAYAQRNSGLIFTKVDRY